MKKIIPVMFFIFLAFPSQPKAAQPLEVLKSAMDEVIVILEDSKYQDESMKEAQQEEIWENIRKIFDFNEMARRTLANNWRNFTSQQQQEFSDVFSRFLGENYLERIQSEFQGEKVSYLGEDMTTDTRAVVMTKVIRGSVETPIDYSMMLRNGTWKVYDVKVEGVSLMKNYRSQFSSILLKESPDQLIERLKDKIE